MDILHLFVIFIAIEIFESNWQKAPTLYRLIENNFLVFQKSIFLYFSLHLSFFYLIYLSLSMDNYSFLMLSIFALKFFDITLKLSIMKKLAKGEAIENILPYDVKLSFVLRYLNVLIYPISFLLSSSL